jgi:hypothetical protein
MGTGGNKKECKTQRNGLRRRTAKCGLTEDTRERGTGGKLSFVWTKTTALWRACPLQHQYLLHPSRHRLSHSAQCSPTAVSIPVTPIWTQTVPLCGQKLPLHVAARIPTNKDQHYTAHPTNYASASFLEIERRQRKCPKRPNPSVLYFNRSIDNFQLECHFNNSRPQSLRLQ